MHEEQPRPPPRRTECPGPPAPDDGWVDAVRSERVAETATAASRRECQHCGAAVAITTPHVRARIGRYRDRSPIYAFVYFCDRDCWKGWATKGDS